jgi:hypothetical protein
MDPQFAALVETLAPKLDHLISMKPPVAKERIRGMEYRYVEETDQNRQALLEIYCAVVFGDAPTMISVRTERSPCKSLAISVPRGETAVLRHFQAQMPYGLFVPDVDAASVDHPRRPTLSE